MHVSGNQRSQVQRSGADAGRTFPGSGGRPGRRGAGIDDRPVHRIRILSKRAQRETLQRQSFDRGLRPQTGQRLPLQLRALKAGAGAAK